MWSFPVPGCCILEKGKPRTVPDIVIIHPGKNVKLMLVASLRVFVAQLDFHCSALTHGLAQKKAMGVQIPGITTALNARQKAGEMRMYCEKNTLR